MKYVIALGFVAVIVGVFAYTAIFDAPQESSEETITAGTVSEMEQQDSTVDPSQDERTFGKATLEALRVLDKDMECTIRYDTETEGQQMEGTFFVADNRMRGDFLTESPDMNGQMLSSIILDGTILYTWSEIEGKMYGMRVDTSVFDESKALSNQAVSTDTEVEYECMPWENIDNTIFTPPSDVLFQDFNEILEAGMEYGTVYQEGAEVPY